MLPVDTSEVTLGDWGRGGSHEGLGSFSKAIETYNVRIILQMEVQKGYVPDQIIWLF